MGVIAVTRITPQQLAAFQVSTANASIAFALQNALIAIGSPAALKTTSGIGVPNFLQVIITQPSMVDQIAFPGDWVLVTDATYDATTNAWTVAGTTQVIVYGIGTGQVGNAIDFVDTFTANTPVVWAATVIATAQAALTATLVFQQPTSADGPFTYSLTGPGTAGAFTTDADGNVTVTVTGLTAGEVSWTVTVSTPYSGVTATSLATAAVTAFSTPPTPDPTPST
jgi:hypothetical protein